MPNKLTLFVTWIAVLALTTPTLGMEKPEEQAAEKEEKWDVANPPDQTYEIEVDTEEGTWMCLDISPDGKEIVFDMLGDIFIIPVAGGEAKPLASGLAWDMQPRFSPNGQTIAFTSDRGGGDNIWIMDRDGANPRAVSKETFRLLNSPAWSPDGDYIAARKHFTKTRSLGAGEIWLYHRAGGGGLQLTKKPNDQKDVGEPAFSPDGRYLYYSQDVTPGPLFEYSKDPTPGIYAINRFDRETGETERLIGGLGGAIRPTPSPDGRTIAYIRRRDYDTAIYLYQLDSGKNELLYSGLDRDLQETWAIHGVYASMAWTPDNKSIIFWAGGKINRIELASRETTVIPFHVKTKHTMVKPVRFPVSVAPDQFEVRMTRWVQASPNGKTVIFQALGHLYIRELPNGKPRRLTRQTDHGEYYPSFSRDGKAVVYTTWNDESLGSIRIVPVTGGEGKKISDQPGHYLEPVFSPDGAHIVYRKSQGGYIRASLWSNEPGLYLLPIENGKPKLISKNGAQPHFGKTGDRIFFLTFGSEGKQILQSTDLSGNEERQHMESVMGGNFRVSPDGNWVAFTENFNAYISPFVLSGQTISMAPNGANIPTQKVSGDAGDALHWSGDSGKLYWSLGNTLYQRELKNTFAFIDGAPDEMPEPEKEGVSLGFEAAYDKPSGIVAFKGARIITMNGDEVIENGVIIVEENRIKELGADLVIPAKAHVVDATGMTIMPGLIDVHAHGPYGTNEIIPQQNWSLYAGLAFGVTTVHDPSSDTSTVFAASEMAKAGMITAPRIYSTGTILYGATIPNFTAKIDGVEDARFHLRRMKAAGAFSVKSYNQPRRDQRQQVILAARELGMMVVPEGGSLFQHNMTMVADGHTGIEHSIPVAQVYNDVIQFWSQSETYYTPTLVVGYGGIWGENYWYEHHDVWKNKRLRAFVPDFVIEPRSRRRVKAPLEEYNHFRNAAICKKLVDAGLHVQLGAHGQREGLAAHWETWMFVQGGMTPMQALRSATFSGAKYLGLDGDIGSLQKGKLADLIVLEKNPLEDIYHTETIQYVMVNGRLYDAHTMDQIGNHPQKRKPFFWEREGSASPHGAVQAQNIGKCGGFCNH